MTYEQLKNDVRSSAFKKMAFGFLVLVVCLLVALIGAFMSNEHIATVAIIIGVVYFKWCLIVGIIRLIWPGMRANKLMRKQGKLDGTLKSI